MQTEIPATQGGKLAFIGAGNMASSLILGLIRKGRAPASILTADPSAAQRHKLSQQGVSVHSDNLAVGRESRVIVLAVKPQVLKHVVQELRPVLTRRHLLISIAAGIPVSAIEAWAGQTLAIIRCMPNTPALIGAGMSALYSNPAVQPEHRASAESLLTAVGKFIWVKEEGDLDVVTALSGSGPAYFFYLMEAMQKAGQELGLEAETVSTLVQETAYGAALMARQGDASVAQLRQNVTSPGGTTEAALTILEASRTEEIIGQALKAAAERSRQLAKTTG